MSFGENLKKARIAAGLTQTELAKRTGVTERSIYNYEKNSRAPKIDVAERFAQALGERQKVCWNWRRLLLRTAWQRRLHRRRRCLKAVCRAAARSCFLSRLRWRIFAASSRILGKQTTQCKEDVQ